MIVYTVSISEADFLFLPSLSLVSVEQGRAVGSVGW